MNKKAILAFALVALLPGAGFGHGGGLDSNGGHFNRKTGVYHCHRCPCGCTPEQNQAIVPGAPMRDRPRSPIANQPVEPSPERRAAAPRAEAREGAQEAAPSSAQSPMARARVVISISAEQPEVVDGDTLHMGPEKIRLHGIDAPESDQTCRRDGEVWACGKAATVELTHLIAGQQVRCEGEERDKYGRLLAVCRAGAVDLNAALVTAGLALAYRQYSTDYVAQEQEAQAARRGMWAGEFTAPWDWRHGPGEQSGLPDTSAAGGNCSIKGNISSSGERIYHIPGSAWYARTQIDASKGERWFCSEDEARAAGWRSAAR